MNSSATGIFFIDVYRNLSADSGGYGQGQFYLGTVSVTTDGSGNAAFACTNSSRQLCRTIHHRHRHIGGRRHQRILPGCAGRQQTPPSAQFTAPYQSRPNGFAFSLTLQTNFGYHIQAATNLVAPIAWVNLTNFIATNPSLVFTDHLATNYPTRFYRVVSP